MQFGLAYEMQRPTLDDHAVIEETIEQCVLADEMGFDYVWFVEHHFLTTFSSSPCPEVIFGALSPADQEHPAGLRRGHPALPPSRAGGRTGSHGGPPFPRPRGFRHGPLRPLRADGHGH